MIQVRENQETRLKPYFAELEMNIKEKLTIAEKRREEVCFRSAKPRASLLQHRPQVLGKVVESAREESRRAELVRQNRARIQVRSRKYPWFIYSIVKRYRTAKSVPLHC